MPQPSRPSRAPTARILHFLVLAASACATWEPAPLDPPDILQELAVVTPESAADRLSGEVFDPRDGLDRREAAALAVTLNPRLQALRAEVGVASARLVEAGLLPNPEVGWDAVDWLVGGTRDDFLTGLGLMQPLPRPGELSARQGVARARLEEVRWEILAGEWALRRDVDRAILDVVAARERRALNQRLAAVATSTHDFFARGLEVGAATALQENLAQLELASIEREQARLGVALDQAWERLNALLGLPPGSRFELQAELAAFSAPEPLPKAAGLAEVALERRPEVHDALAWYRLAEQALRLEVARQWPTLAVGTGLSLVLPVFTRWNRPAIRTAEEVRERTARELRATVHRLRSEVHAAWQALRLAADQVHIFRDSLEPRIERNVRLTEEALRLGEATLAEILVAQRQVLDTRREYLDARVQLARAAIDLEWAIGPPLEEKTATEEEE